MDFGAFSIISLIYVVIGVRIVAQLVQNWKAVWDHNFTIFDRQIVDQAAFFVLIPVSVALHELGHAIAVWGFGGRVLDFGFYGFAGYVSYSPRGFSAEEQTIVAAAGTIVNLALCVIALAVVFFRRPPMRAAFNELLIQFAIISGLNAFIVYPLLDVASGLNGDWRQMYDSGVPWLSAIIVLMQAAVLFGGYWLLTNPGMKARAASLTDVPPGLERGILGGLREGKVDPARLNPAEKVLHEAIDRVSSGWQEPVRTGIQRFQGGTAITLQWNLGPRHYVVAARTFANGSTDLVSIPTNSPAPEAARPRLLHRWQTLPSTDELTLGLRLAMETAEREG
jgi:membrane-associated protease RseP (regulator of RpoE activity)